MEFRHMSPVRRAEEALRWCVERKHTAGKLCCVCAAEVIDKTMDEGVKLAAGINEQALKLMDAGEDWKKKYDAANLQVREKTEHLQDLISAIDRDHHLTLGGTRLDKHGECWVCAIIERGTAQKRVEDSRIHHKGEA